MQVTIWNEFVHEQNDETIRAVYPDGIHGALADELRNSAAAEQSGEKWRIVTTTLQEPDNGVPDSLLDETDVLIWWAHAAHDDVADETAGRVQRAVLNGMGLIALHSAHYSKPFRLLMGTSCGLSWREDGLHERLWVVDPTHPIAEGIESSFVVPETEMYGEFFDVPTPDELVFISWYPGGEVFRSGMVWKRGRGRIFYFSPGHETYPIYHQPEVVRVIANACRYVHAGSLPHVTGIGDAPMAEVSPEARRSGESGATG